MANKSIPEDTSPVSAASDDDCAHLRGRSRQEVQHWVSVEKQALQRRILDLEFLHNSTILMNTLPNEIFVPIIRLAGGDCTMAWILKAMGVCRHWRQTIIHTPLLWTDIHLTRNIQFSALCLTRSSGAAINWRVFEARARRPPPIDWCSATGSLLALHHERIKHMRIYFEEAITPLVQPHWQLSTVALPVLVSMDLTAVSGLSSQWIPSYFPSLRRLSLYRLSIDDTNLSLSQLTSLELNEIHFRARSLASLLDVLKTCTSLRHFVYGDTDDTPFKKSSVAAGYRVSLPRIRHFLIIATSANISSLLAHVLLAKQTRILLKPKDFHPRQDENDHLPVLNAILPRDAAYWPAMKDVTHIMVWWEEGDGITVYADGKNTEFWESHPWRSLDYENLSADGLSPAPALFIEHINIHSSSFPSSIMGPLLAIVEELGDLFPASAKTFVLRGYAEEISTETWAQTLARFPVIEHFELVAEVDAMCTFPLALRPTSSGIPCPRLRELVLRYEAGAERDNSSWRMLDDLRVVLQERVGGGSRLQSLILQLDPPPEVEVFELFRQSTLLTATGRWPPDFEDIQRELALLVGSLKISYRGPYDEWITVV